MCHRTKYFWFRTDHGSVIVIPEATNKVLPHRVPHEESDIGRRISVTLRAFEWSRHPPRSHRGVR